MRNEADGVAAAIDEAILTARAAERIAGRPARLQISHLKAAARSVYGTGPALVAQIEAARAAGLDAAADQYPYTAAHTTLATILPPDLLALDLDDAVAVLRDPAGRRRIRDLQASGIAGWENVATDPGWDGDGDRLLGDPARVERQVAGRDRRDRGRRPGRPGAWTSSPTSAWRSTASCTAWTRVTSRRSWPCPGSPCAPMARPAARTTRSSGVASRTRGRTGPRHASWAGTCASAACSRSRRPSRS